MTGPRTPGQTGRSVLATHEVTNQPPPLGDLNLFDADPLLAGCVARSLAKVPADAGADQRAQLSRLGAEVGRAEVRDWGRQADENPPVLRAFDRYGHRLDEVEFHPAYHALMRTGLEAGVASRAWTHTDGGHVAHAGLLTLMGWADAGVCCPMSMTYAAVPALRQAGWSDETWTPRALSARYDAACAPPQAKSGATIGMAMTEKQGGSDVRANTARALNVDADGIGELVGHKWFCSAPMCDAFLTLAYEEAGLSCFLVPKWAPDDTRNAIEIQRLKNKLGDRSNASSEIEYRGAWARRIGAPGRGVATIIEMVHHTRLDCLVGSAGGVRVAVALAGHHVAHRTAFQKRLIDQPVMRAVLADLSLEATAGTALAFRIAAAFDAARAGDDHEAALARVATPVAKYWLCKRAPNAVYEAMECHGGAGYVEESGLPRLFRQSPLNAIWEGSGNVIALDVLRALGRDASTRDALRHEISLARGHGPALDALLKSVDADLAAGGVAEADARGFAERCALALTAAALAPGDPQLLDAFAHARVASPSLTFGANMRADDTGPLIAAAALAA